MLLAQKVSAMIRILGAIHKYKI